MERRGCWKWDPHRTEGLALGEEGHVVAWESLNFLLQLGRLETPGVRWKVEGGHFRELMPDGLSFEVKEEGSASSKGKQDQDRLQEKGEFW